MKRALFHTTPALLLACFASCASTTMSEAAPVEAAADKDEESAEDKAKKVTAMESKLELARDRLAMTKMQSMAFDEAHKIRVRHANAEIELATAKLATFRDVDAPNKIAGEQLNLRSSKDRAQEAAEELEQIEIMYKDQDLDDRTAEFVVSRGRRNAERASARIAIMEASLAGLEQHELPAQRKQLELALDKASTALANINREGEIGVQGKAISVKEGEAEIAQLEGELADLRKGDA
jgi:hypothetical protein